MSEPIPEVYGRNKLIVFLKKYLLGDAPGHEPKKIAVINLVTSFITGPTTFARSTTLSGPSISFSDITVPDGLILTIDSGATLVVKDVSDF